MKRTTFPGLLLAAAVLVGLATPAAAAIVTPPPPPAGCVQVSAPAAPWPAGAHTWRCGSASQVDANTMLTVLQGFSGMPRANTEMIALAANTNRGNFYIFGTQQEYKNSTLNGYKTPSSPGTAGLTYSDPSTGAPEFSATWVASGDVPPLPNQFLKNTVAHELGHWLDALSGAALSKQEKITLAGTVSAGHIISLAISNGNIAGSPVTVTSTPATVAGDTLATLATRLKNAINANGALSAAGVTATVSAESITITYAGGGSGPTYSYSISGAGVTEQVWLDMGAKASEQALFKHSLHGTNPEVATIGGAITAGDKITLNFRDPAFNVPPTIPPTDLTQTVSYTVVGGDTTTTIATALKNAINAKAVFAGKVNAVSAGAVITITSTSGVTDYGATVSGAASETVTMAGDVPSFNKLSNCNAANTGVFNQRQDHSGDYICSTKETGTVGGGPVFVNGNATLTITDFYAGGANPVSVGIVPGDTPTTIATKFKTAINAPGPLKDAKISADASGGTLTIISASGFPTTFAFNAGGTNVTMNLSVPGYGRNDSLSILTYGPLASNWTNVNVAWPNSFFSLDAETFAENYAIIANYDDRAFPNGTTNYLSQDWYFMFNPSFPCIRNVISTAGNTRLPPTAFPAGCPVN